MKHILLLPMLALIGCMGVSAPTSVSTFDAQIKDTLTPKMSCPQLKRDMEENEAIITAIGRGAYSSKNSEVKLTDMFNASAWSQSFQNRKEANDRMKVRFEELLQKQKTAYSSRC